MKNVIQVVYTHITMLKAIFLGFLFSPLWGLWWFTVDPVVPWGILRLWLPYLHMSIKTGIAYIMICIIAFVSVVIVTFIRSSAIRVPLMLLMLIGWVFELSMLDLNSTLSSQNLFWIFWLERGRASEAIGGYGFGAIRDCVAVVILGIVLCAPPARRFSISGIFGFLPVVSGALVAGAIIYTNGYTQAFPIPFSTFANAAIVLVQAFNRVDKPLLMSDLASSGDGGIDHEVKVGTGTHPLFNKVVMIMDESVRGDYLSLNDAARNTTPFLKATTNLVNFGVAISGANCSYVSRTMFRFGMRHSDLPNGWREGLNRPTFWEFAHRAGYKTVYVDALSYGSLDNWLSVSERMRVDSTVRVSNNPGYLRDQVLVGTLLGVLKDEAPTFVYVEKFGVHFPYSDKSPSDFEPLTVLKSDNEKVEARFGTTARKRELAHYPKAIAWSVDEFFRGLLPGLNLSKTLIIYTSDHGVNLVSSHFQHCTMAPPVPPGEQYVPLFALTSEPYFEQRLGSAASNGFGQFSHFEIFPTLLLAMGYDAGWVKRSYGPSLIDRPSPDREFMIGVPDSQSMMIPVKGVFDDRATGNVN
jgi:glucan phosphoethanolaminetransferase (alkaline phosphatase superfamily)